jgi:hypothetical protein
VRAYVPDAECLGAVAVEALVVNGHVHVDDVAVLHHLHATHKERMMTCHQLRQDTIHRDCEYALNDVANLHEQSKSRRSDTMVSTLHLNIYVYTVSLGSQINLISVCCVC